MTRDLLLHIVSNSYELYILRCNLKKTKLGLNATNVHGMESLINYIQHMSYMHTIELLLLFFVLFLCGFFSCVLFYLIPRSRKV